METIWERLVRVLATVARSDEKTIYWFAHSQPEWKMETKAVLAAAWLLLCAMAIIITFIYLNTQG